MPNKKFSQKKIKEITGASRSKTVNVPSYYAPPFIDELREIINSRLSSTGGRPTLQGLDVIRKIRFSKRNWRKLESIASNWSKEGNAVSPGQVATSILDKFVSNIRIRAK